MEKVVVDSSVIVKWFIDEDNSDKAKQLLNDNTKEKITLYVPDIAILEVINALFYQASFDSDRLLEVVKTLYHLEINIVNLSETLSSLVVDKMLKNKIASYDALFIALAEKEKCPLVTADYKHHKRRFSKRIKYLSYFHC